MENSYIDMIRVPKTPEDKSMLSDDNDDSDENEDESMVDDTFSKTRNDSKEEEDEEDEDDEDDGLNQTDKNQTFDLKEKTYDCPQSAAQDTLNTSSNTADLKTLKKNLANEEEFKSINHSDPIHIFLKMKPLSQQEMQRQHNVNYFEVQSDCGVSVKPPKNSVYSQNKQKLQTLTQTVFQFSYVFQSEITQKDFFLATIFPCFEKFFRGDNLLIFSYGVTNSGKTYTMQGTSLNPGLIPRTLDFLFDTLNPHNASQQQQQPQIDLMKKKPRSIFRYKPDKFNEIVLLNEAELNQELAHKENIIRLATSKELERTESIDSIKDFADRKNFMDSKKFGSLDSIKTAANSDVTNTTTTELSSKFQLPANKQFAIWISFFELYNDSFYDLLTILPTKNLGDNRPALKIREDSNRIPFVEGLTYVPVSNTKEAIKILKFGEKNLQKSSNSINQSSSRSHAIFCLKVVSLENDAMLKGQSFATINQLCFCDLAGIERSSKTQAVGKLHKEATNINQSLLSLSRCINTMIENQKNKTNPNQVPYRTNKLTRLFQAYFEGRGMVKMVVNLNPSLSCFNESVNVLKFSSIANQIQIVANDEAKIKYKVNNESTVHEGRLTVNWENDGYQDEDEEEEEYEESGEEEEEEEEEDCSEEEDDEESGEEEEESEEGSEEEESEEGDEESEEEGDEEDETMEESPVKKKPLTTNNTTIKKTVKIKEKTPTRSKNSKSPKESTVKKTFKKTPFAQKTASILKPDPNSTKNVDKSQLGRQQPPPPQQQQQQQASDPLKKLTNEQLISMVNQLKKELDQSKKDSTKYECELRAELVGKWSKRVEDTEKYYEEQIKTQRAQVEDTYLKRMSMLETLLDRKAEKKLNELRCEKDNEMEKLREQIVNSDLELRKSEEEANNLRKLNEELSNNLKVLQVEHDVLLANYNQKNDKLLLNSTEINTPLNSQKSKSKSLGLISMIKEEMVSQSGFECELKLDNEEEEDETMDQTTSYSKNDETTRDEDEEEEDESDDESMKETLIDTIKGEKRSYCQATKTHESSCADKTSLCLIDQFCQTDKIETFSIQCEADIDSEELLSIREKLRLKEYECKLLDDKLTAKIKQIEQLKTDIDDSKNRNNQHETDHKLKLIKVEEELASCQTKLRENERTITDLNKRKQIYIEKYERVEASLKIMEMELKESEASLEKMRMELKESESLLEATLKQVQESDLYKKGLEECEIKNGQLEDELESMRENELKPTQTRLNELEADCAKMSKEMKQASKKNELLEYEIQYKQNQIDKLSESIERLSEERDTLRLKVAQANVELENMKAAREEAEKKAAPVDVATTPMDVDDTVEAEGGEEEEEPAPIVKPKTTRAASTKSKAATTKKKPAIAEEPEEEEVEEVVTKKPVKTLSRASSKKVVAEVKPEEPVEDEAEEEISRTSRSSTILKPKTALVKKKSTFKQIADIISKSPILEPLKARAARSKVKASQSTEGINAASNLSTLSNGKEKETTKTSKASKTTLADKLKQAIVDENNENLNPEEIVVEPEDNKRKTRKKKV